jgi:hypothetical protein
MLITCNTWWWRERKDAGVCQPQPRGATDADPRALSVCERRESKSPFSFILRDPKNPSKTFLLSIIEVACAFRLAGRPGLHVVCEYAQTRVEAGARLARRHTFASEGRIVPQASST